MGMLVADLQELKVLTTKRPAIGPNPKPSSTRAGARRRQSVQTASSRWYVIWVGERSGKVTRALENDKGKARRKGGYGKTASFVMGRRRCQRPGNPARRRRQKAARTMFEQHVGGCVARGDGAAGQRSRTSTADPGGTGKEMRIPSRQCRLVGAISHSVNS